MKKIKYLLFILFMFIGMSSVYADCYSCSGSNGAYFQTSSNYNGTGGCSRMDSDVNGKCIIPKNYSVMTARCEYIGVTYNNAAVKQSVTDNSAIVSYDATTGKVFIEYYDEYEAEKIKVDITLNANYFFSNSNFECKNFVIHSSEANEFGNGVVIDNKDGVVQASINNFNYLYYTKYTSTSEQYKCNDSSTNIDSKNYVGKLTCKSFSPASAQLYMGTLNELCIDDEGSLFYKENGKNIKVENYTGVAGQWPSSISLERNTSTEPPKFVKNCFGSGYYCSLYTETVNYEVVDIPHCYLCDGNYKWLNSEHATDCTIIEDATTIDSCVELSISIDDQNYEDTKPISTNNGCAILTPSMIDALNYALNIIKYGGTVLAVLLGMLDFFKATVSDDDGATKKASTRFIKRLIAAALIFILPALIQFLLTSVKIPGVNVDSVTCGVGIDESI